MATKSNHENSKEDISIEWMNNNMPNAERVDFSEYSMSKWNFPSYVKEYIQQNWRKINDINGGEYQKPKHLRKLIICDMHMINIIKSLMFFN